MFQRNGFCSWIIFFLFLTISAATTSKLNAKNNAPHVTQHSDLLMAPNDFTSITVLRSEEQEFPPLPTPNQYQTNPHAQAQARDFQSTYSNTQTNTQNYHPHYFQPLPPFVPPHARAYVETPYKTAIPNHLIPLPLIERPAAPFPTHPDDTLLGSGNFGVLRGGTFYADNELPNFSEASSHTGDYYADASNSQGHASQEDFIEKYTYPEQQFEHFRDFADLNAHIEGAYSQSDVVNMTKNASKPEKPVNLPPRNIFEKLELIEHEQQLETKKMLQSRSKSKLAKSNLQKKSKTKAERKSLDYDPLLALS